jgi:hypothetical protein
MSQPVQAEGMQRSEFNTSIREIPLAPAQKRDASYQTMQKSARVLDRLSAQ